MLPRESKMMLANIIRHTDTHNRIIEEEECWKQRALQRANEAKEFRNFSEKNSIEITQKKCNWLNESRKIVGESRAHMDCKDDIQHHSYEGREEPRGTFWMRQLDNFESRDPDRWGHSGYKELYPQDFLSDSEKDNVKQMDKCRSSKKRSYSPEPTTKKKHKKSHSVRTPKEKKKKSKKKKRRSSSRESETRKKHHRRGSMGEGKEAPKEHIHVPLVGLTLTQFEAKQQRNGKKKLIAHHAKVKTSCVRSIEK